MILSQSFYWQQNASYVAAASQPSSQLLTAHLYRDSCICHYPLIVGYTILRDMDSDLYGYLVAALYFPVLAFRQFQLDSSSLWVTITLSPISARAESSGHRPHASVHRISYMLKEMEWTD